MKTDENLPLDRETKILFLSVLRQGYFTPKDIETLKSKIETDDGVYILVQDGIKIRI
jgi:predicted ATP-dependent Lon-type protease